MAQVRVTVAGRMYRMACGDGEEPHLEEMASQVDAKIAELRGSFGEIGDQRLTVMAAIMMADEMSELRRQMEAMRTDLQMTREAGTLAENASAGWTDSLTQTLESAAARIERLARELNATGQAAG